MIMLLLLLFEFLVQVICQGFVRPDKPTPIVPYRNNELATGEYNFYVSFDNRILNNARIEIVFPQEFKLSEILLTNECAVEVIYSNQIICPTYIQPVLQSNLALTIILPTDQILYAGSHLIIVRDIKNPQSYGGLSTGNFKIRTLFNNVEVDSNENFGQIGFAQQYISYIYKENDPYGMVTNNGSNLSGYTTDYILSFKTTVSLLAQSQFRLEFAPLFDLSSLSCTLLETAQDLQCWKSGQRVYFTPLSNDLPIGSHQVLLKNVKNPYSSGSSGSFIFETLLPYVNTVVEYYFLKPVILQPGLVKNPSLEGSPLNKNLRIDYTVKFTPTDSIPLDGRIEYNFPVGYTLDSTCRIIYGLSPAQASVSCVSVGVKVIITGFGYFNSQEVCFKIYAINPSVSKVYGPFTVATYSNFGTTVFNLIDENLNAGQVSITDIESPYFVAVDLYKPFLNLSLDSAGPIDFHIYPMNGKELGLSTSSTTFSEIYIQIPLWWRLQQQTFNAQNTQGSIPVCMFGDEPSRQCQYNLQVFRVQTPQSRNKPTYPLGSGLGSCDLPLSISSIRLTPIPGRWDFRVMTIPGDTYLNFITTPYEQDLYTMEITADPFPTSSIVCTSKDQGDTETVCQVNLKVGLPIPWEGAVNLNMSTVSDSIQSAWPQNIGFSQKSIPCQVQINLQIVGIVGSLHPNVGCFIFAGDSTRSYAIIQVRGFSSLIASGSTIQAIIPDMKICTDANLKCYIQLSSSYTTDLVEPYTLNIIKINVATIVSGSVSQDISSGSTSFSGGLEICTDAKWTFSFNLATSINVNDYILVKFPRDRFIQNNVEIFRRSGASSDIGTVYVIDNFIHNQIYYFIVVTKTLSAASPANFYLSNIRNPYDSTPGLDIQMVYWQSQRRTARITFPTSQTFNDGGILSAVFQILPKYAYSTANRDETIDMDYNSNIDFMVSFMVCNEVPTGGSIQIQRQSGLISSDSDCNIWQGVTSAPSGLGYVHQCKLVGNYYEITNFNKIPPLTQIIISFRGKTGSTSVTSPPITIKTYTSLSNIQDYNANTLNGIDITGPNTFPTKLEWKPFQDNKVYARLNDRAEFYFTIKYSYNIDSYTVNPNARIIVTFPVVISCPGIPYCRIDGKLVQKCDWNSGVLSISMPPDTGITANTDTLIMVSTRGADGSATTKEGLSLDLSGRYQIQIQTSNTNHPDEFTYVVFNIKPKEFSNFWVWSSNKIAVDPIDSNPDANMALYRIAFTNPLLIPPSNNLDPVQLILEFYRYVSDTFANGFARDLGTGQGQRYDLPCLHKGFNLLTGYTKLLCRLNLGSYPNPTKVIITGFDRIPPNTQCEIHLPNIFNPVDPLQMIEVGLTAQVVRSDTGATVPLLQGTYTLVNNTFGRVSWTGAPQISIDVKQINVGSLSTQWPTAIDPSFSVTSIDTLDQLNIQWASKDHNLGGGSDCVIIEVPELWNLPYGVVPCVFPSGGINCISYPDAHQIILFINSDIPKNTLQKGTITIKTPPYQTVVSTNDPPINIYVNSRSKIVDIWSTVFKQKMSSVQVTVTVQATNKLFGEVDEYVIIISNPNDIPTTGAIQIIYPPELALRENGCRNDIIGGSQLSSEGFLCDSSNGQLLIYGFTKFVGPGTIRILVRLQNPSTQPTGGWDYKSYYLNENPLNKLITYGSTTTPTLQTQTDNLYWETPYLSRRRALETELASLEILLTLSTDSVTDGKPIMITMPFINVQCSQLLCLWDKTPWFDNHNDNWWEAPCTYDSPVLTIQKPFNGDVAVGDQYRLIIDSQNAVNGLNGLLLPSYGTKQFIIETSTEKVIGQTYVPKNSKFTAFESYTLLTNSQLKTLFQIKFTPNQAIPVGGKIIVYFPTLSWDNQILFANDLGSGLKTGDQVNCQKQQGFLANVLMTCIFSEGVALLGQDAYITITGTWTIALTANYGLLIDQIVNPITTNDNKRITIRLESYDQNGLLLDQSFSYDYTVKQDSSTTETLPKPSASTKGLLDSGVTYGLVMKSPVLLSGNNLYDYFIVEFPEPVYSTQPVAAGVLVPGIKCLDASGAALSCSQAQGNNWVIIKISGTLAANTEVSFTLTGCDNPVYLPVAGVTLKSYAISNRVVVAQYTYTAITDFSQVSGGSSFTVTSIELSDVDVPLGGFLRYQVVIQVSQQSLGLDYGTIVDVIAPAGYIPYSNCENDITGGSMVTISQQMHINCDVSDSTEFVGRKVITFTGYDYLLPGQVMKFIIYIQTPQASGTAVWNFQTYSDISRVQKFFGGSYTGTTLNPITPFVEFKFSPKYPVAIRQNMKAPFKFTFMFPDAVTSASEFRITFPSSALVSIPSGCKILCYFNNGVDLPVSNCQSTLQPDKSFYISVFFPEATAPQLSVNTFYDITVTTTEGNQMTGLLFGASGVFQVGLLIGTATGMMEIEVLPTQAFSNPLIKIVNSQGGQLSGFIVKFSLTKDIPVGGKIVVGFPTKSADGSVRYFQDYLYSSSLTNGAAVTCTTSSSELYKAKPDCRIFMKYGRVPRTIIVLQSFPDKITSRNELSFVIEDISIYYETGAGSIPLELYTVDAHDNKLEAYIFYDWYAPTPNGTPGALTVTFFPSDNYIQQQNKLYTFTIKNTVAWSIKPSSMIVFKFPVGQHQIDSVTLNSGTTSKCYQNGQVTSFANYIIYTQQPSVTATTPCGGGGGGTSTDVLFLLDKISNAYSSAQLQYTILICNERSCEYVGTTAVHTFLNQQYALSASTSGLNFAVWQPYCAVKIQATVQMGVSLPAQSKLIVWHKDQVLFIDRIEIISALKTVQFQHLSDLSSGTLKQMYVYILDQAYDSNVNGDIKFDIYARLKASQLQSTDSLYDLGFYTQYSGSPIYSQANSPKLSFVPNDASKFFSRDYSALPLLSHNSIQLLHTSFEPGLPGTNTQNTLYVSFPSFTLDTPTDTNTLYVLKFTIFGMNQPSSSLCAVDWVDYAFPAGQTLPQCSPQSSGVFEINSIIFDALQTWPLVLKITSWTFTDPGTYGVTVVLLSDLDAVRTELGVFNSYAQIHQSTGISSFSNTYMFNDRAFQDNVLAINFQVPSVVGTLTSSGGSLFVDVHSPLQNNQIRKMLCQVGNSPAQCTFLPKSWASGTSTQMDGFYNVLTNRILVEQFVDLLPTAGTQVLYINFDLIFTETVQDIDTKFFTFGYYAKTNGNYMNYKFGKNFNIVIPKSTPTLNSQDFSFAAGTEAQGLMTIDFNFDFSGITSATLGQQDSVFIKLKQGYIANPIYNNFVNPQFPTPTSITMTGATCTFNPQILFIQCKYTDTTLLSSVTINVVNIQAPYIPTDMIGGNIASIYIIKNSDLSVIASLDYQASTLDTTTKAQFETCSVTQYDSNLLYIEFKLQTGFTVFNEYDCSGSNCPQAFQLQSAAIQDLDNYWISCGLDTVIVRHSQPNSNAYLLGSFSSGTFFLKGFAQIQSTDKVCLWIQTVTPLTVGAQSFEFNMMLNSSIQLASCLASFTISTPPSGLLLGMTKKLQLGYLEYYETEANYQRASLGYLSFQFGFPDEPSLGGAFQIYTSSLELSTYDQSQRLRCFFRNTQHPYLSAYSPTGCTIDYKNEIINVPYNQALTPPTSQPQLWDLVVIQDQSYQQFITLPTTSGSHLFQVKYIKNKIVEKSVGFYMDVYEKKCNMVKFRNFIQHATQKTLLQVQYTVSQVLPQNTAYIQLEFPLQEIQFDTSLQEDFPQNLNLGVKHKFKVNCLDKNNNLGSNYYCTYIQGISDFQSVYSAIRVQNMDAIPQGTVISINFMGLVMPTDTYRYFNIRFRVGDISTSLYEFAIIYNLFYGKPAYSGSSTAQGTVLISSSVTNTVVELTYQDTVSVDLLTINQATALLKYNTDLWPQSYIGYLGAIDGVNADIDPMDESSVFITFQSNYLQSTSIEMKISTLQTPLYLNVFQNDCGVKFISNGVFIQDDTQTQSITPVEQNPLMQFSQSQYSSEFKSDSSSLIQLFLTTNGKVAKSNYIVVTVPSQFTLATTPFCRLIRQDNQFNILTTNTFTSSTANLELQQSLDVGTQIILQLQVTNPSTSGTYQFQFQVFQDNTKQKKYLDITSGDIIITDYQRLNAAIYPLQTPQRLLQAKETGPIRLSIKPTVAAAHYLEISTKFLGVIFDFPDPTIAYELQCFWNDQAASSCVHDTINKNIRVYAPSSSTIDIGKLYTVFVTFQRQPDLFDFTYLWDQSTPLTSLTNREVSTYDSTGKLLETFSKQAVVQNYRFAVDPVVPANYITVHQGTLDTNTLINVKFRLPSDMPSALAINWGRLILTLPTKDDTYDQTQFPDDLGRFTTNNELIDCNCKGCPTYSNPLFLCKVYMGASHKSAPAQIWLEPQSTLLKNDIIDITIPKVKLPPTEQTHVKMSLLLITYDSIKKLASNVSEIVHDFTFKTVASTPFTNSIPIPVFTPDFIGQPASVTFTIENKQADISCLCHDRWILESSDDSMVFENPFNPQDNLLYTTATDYDVVIYEQAKWIEFVPSVNIPKSDTQILSIQNLKNMPYQIPNGVNYKLYIWLNVEQLIEYTYDPKSSPPPHGIFYKQITPMPSPALVLQPTTWTVVFQPYNKVPMIKGKILLKFPSYDWTFTESYCSITGGLQDCACDIVSSSSYIQIQDCMNDYDPRVDGKINLQFDVVNPSTSQSTVPFTFESYQSKSETWLIDQDNNVDNIPANQIQSGEILRVQMYELYQTPQIICGGNVGPITLVFSLQNNLYYPNDYIQIDFWSSFQPAKGYQEIICYFTNPSTPKLTQIKSYRCTYDPTIRGGRLQIYIPEEIDIIANDEWEVTFTSRGSYQGNGWLSRSPSDSYWITFSTSSTTDKGWIQATLPGCPFDNTYFNCENVGWEASSVGNPSWSVFNFTASTLYNDIPSGDLNFLGHSRFLFEFQTWNELSNVFPEDLTGRMSLNDNSIEIACNGLIKGNTKPLQAQGNQYIKCTAVRAGGSSTNSTPAYVVVNYYEQIPAGTRFNLQIAEFLNGDVVGTPAHVKITMQVQKVDGTYYSQNEHWCWNAPPGLLSPPNPKTTMTGYVRPSSTQVNTNMGITTFSVTLDTDLQYQDVIIFDYSEPYMLPQKGYCRQYKTATQFSETSCIPHPYNLWFVISNNYPVTLNWSVQERFNFINPPYIYEDGNPKSQLKAYVFRSHQKIYDLQLPNQSPTRGQAYIVLQTTTAENPENEWVKYHVGVIMYTSTTVMTHIRLWAPDDFQGIRNCKINRGLIINSLTNIDSGISCTISQVSTSYPNDKWMIELDNFGTYQGDGWLIIDMELYNPITPRWTKAWRITTFQSVQNLKYIIDDGLVGGQTWVGKNIRPPSLFRVTRNTQSYEDRRAQTNDYAEIDVRLHLRNRHPPTISNTQWTQVEIQMPLNYDIPNRGTTLCNVGNQYHEDLNGQNCNMTSDRQIFLNTDSIYGFQPNCTDSSCIDNSVTTCSLISVTSSGATGGKDGIKLPSVPGNSQFDVYVKSQSSTGIKLNEYRFSQGTAVPQQIDTVNDPNFQVDSLVREEGQLTVVKVKFTAPIDIPTGYATDNGQSDILLANPIGYIQLMFNTLDFANQGFIGFPLNLGQTGTDVLCQGFSQLIAKSGEALKCTLTPSPKVDINYPVIITVSNFEYIQIGDVVEMYFLQILNGNDHNNNGKVELSAFSQYPDGTQIKLIKRTPAYIPVYSTIALRTQFNLYTTCPTSSQVIIVPQNVGAYTQISISGLPLNATFNAGDRFTFQFPNQFEFDRNNLNKISASWNGIQTITKVYIPMNTIVIELPIGTPVQIGSKNTLKLSQLRNAAYSFTLPYSIQYTALKSGYRTVLCTITGITPPLPAAPIRAQLSLSSLLSGDVYVTYQLQFTPSYHIPTGSSIELQLPQDTLTRKGLNYDHISLSNPPATCIVSLSSMGSCTISNIAITTVTTNEIDENTPLQLTIIGAKNPTYIGTTSTNDFVLYVSHSNTFAINKQNLPTFYFFKSRNPGVIYMSIASNNLFKGVTSDYSFTLQSTGYLPTQGFIILNLPIEWAAILPKGYVVSSMSGSWTNDQLAYKQGTVVCDATHCQMPLSTQFSWPSRGSVIVKMNRLVNPQIDQTGVFQALTKYDGVLQDQSDILDESFRFKYLSFTSGVQVNAFIQYPQNEGEVSNYGFDLLTPAVIQGAVQFEFAAPFTSILTTYDKGISCTITLFSTILVNNNKSMIVNTTTSTPCIASERKVNVPVQNINANSRFIINIIGVVNPTIEQAASCTIDILTLGKNGEIQQYTNQAATAQIKTSPKTIKLTYLNVDSNNLQSRANYSICAQTSNTISKNAIIYVDFPSQFILNKNSYDCSLGMSHSISLFPYLQPNCSVDNLLRRIEITGQTSAYSQTTTPLTMCYIFHQIQNPSQPGYSGNFILSVFEPDQNIVTLKTFGNLDSNSTLQFSKNGLMITVGTIQPVPKLTQSLPVTVTLELSVPYMVQITPQSNEFNFIPTILKFTPQNGSQLTFTISPMNQNVLVGTKTITWTKTEEIQPDRFSELPDTDFEYIEKPVSQSVSLTIYPLVFRSPLGANSLPISLTLSQAASQVVQIKYTTITQDNFIEFDPPITEIQPGNTQAILRYKTKLGAISSSIQFSIQPPYDTIYYMPANIINFEILGLDTQKPTVVQYYALDIKRSLLYFRASVDESVTLYYELTLKGCQTPNFSSILTHQTPEPVFKIFGSQVSNQSEINNNYIYNDIYLYITDLEEQTDYSLFFFVEDLSGNYNDQVIQYDFTTKKKALSAEFQISFSSNVTEDQIISALGLITGLSNDRFELVQTPDNSGNSGKYTWTFRILSSKSDLGKTPKEYIKMLDFNQDIMIREIPTFIPGQTLSSTTKEIFILPQEFKYTPVVYNITEASVFIQASLKYSGILFAVILPEESNSPSSKQIQMGLDSSNMKLQEMWTHNYTFIYQGDSDEVVQDDLFSFSMLFDNTQYNVFLTAQNDLPVNPDLMTDDKIQKLTFKTLREVIVIPETYIYGTITHLAGFVLLILII